MTMDRRNFISRCFQAAVGLLGIGCVSKKSAKAQKPPLGTPLNKNHPLTHGLVGYELMNEGHYRYKMGFNHALSEEEVNLLYRDPYCMFDKEQISMWFA